MSFFKTGKGPFIIAGPCSAESREQVLNTAEAIKDIPVQLFRSGVWKPRTRPGSFEGKGIEALAWLKEIKEQYGLLITVEVAEPEHVELALKFGMDCLWVGARTTVNPFQVQHIADALKGVVIPIMVKNPVSPDVDLWQGAIERFERMGIKDIAAIHRGFPGYNTNSPYRNQPNWPIPIELKRRKPELPVFSDPSHITGNRTMVETLAQKAMDLGFEGLMIETHPDPDRALTDAAQQITPAALKELLHNLVVRDQHVTGVTESIDLEHLRQVMDSVDAEIIDLLARRMELSEKMGLLKKEHNVTAYQPARWRDIVETRCQRAVDLKLSKEFILALYEKIHDESIRTQLEILQNKDTFKEVKS